MVGGNLAGPGKTHGHLQVAADYDNSVKEGIKVGRMGSGVNLHGPIRQRHFYEDLLACKYPKNT